MNDANGSGGSSDVIASRGANDVMRKLVAMEKIFVKNKKMNDSSIETIWAQDDLVPKDTRNCISF